ncbi:ferrous iron transport protein B [Pseudopedobacter beijingensis]|uniref:Ferrous iron transport protein B n=1 Tax=Pseudopedobacter beijingensis TaxID=1207056 RepID=A0ABW4IAG6_9SPHI
MERNLKVALVGNPNTGKSTIFNALTGLNQKVGNFPGITVDKKTGISKLPNGKTVDVIDLPGTYSLYPKSADESIVFEVLSDKTNSSFPDLVVIVADATNLKRNLLLYTQIADLKIPVIIALNMMDQAEKSNIEINVDAFSKKLNVPVVPLSARKGQGINKLKEAISHSTLLALQLPTINVADIAPALIAEIQQELNVENQYAALQIAHQHEHLKYLSQEKSDRVEELEQKHGFHSQKAQAKETIERYNFINEILADTVKYKSVALEENISNKIDHVLTHKIWGFVIFFAIMMFVFNAIFSWAEYPMELIENLFAWIGEVGHEKLPEGLFTSLLLDGIVAGLGGIVVFIPQIAILFAFIAILEDTGYMSRVTFMMDRLMRKVGLNGKSVVPMIGGLACAVPSIMAARNIESWKDRMITIMVTPLISCSARLPVYTLLISLVVPDEKVFGFLSMQALVLMALYLIGFIAAFLIAWVMKVIIKAKDRGYFVMEMPVYRMPRWNNVLLTMYDKSKTFVLQAGKVIIAISIILWVMATFAPGDRFEKIDEKYATELANADDEAKEHIEVLISTEKLENSYIGLLGHAIEPVIRPLGYDWKIGIGLITSFAAREAFVGTMATIYSVDGGEEDTSTIRERMAASINPNTGMPVYTLATGVSLMLFYAFAMQCMSTVAIVQRETKSWKWPLIQIGYMTLMAYVCGLIAYQLLK